jgi:hypothetical protein
MAAAASVHAEKGGVRADNSWGSAAVEASRVQVFVTSQMLACMRAMWGVESRFL